MGILNIGYSTDSDPIKKGATFVLNCSLTSTSSTASAFNLTGYGVRAKMRQYYNSTAVTSFTASILSATGGTLRLTLGSTVTEGLTVGRYVYDAEIYTTSTASAVVVNRFIEGKALVTDEVTY